MAYEPIPNLPTEQDEWIEWQGESHAYRFTNLGAGYWNIRRVGDPGYDGILEKRGNTYDYKSSDRFISASGSALTLGELARIYL